MDAAEEEKVRNLQPLFLVFKLCPLVFSLGHIYWHHTAKPVPVGPTWESIMYLLWLEHMAYGPRAARSLRQDPESQIFSFPAPPNSVHKYFIIPPLLHLILLDVFLKGTFECLTKV